MTAVGGHAGSHSRAASAVERQQRRRAPSRPGRARIRSLAIAGVEERRATGRDDELDQRDRQRRRRAAGSELVAGGAERQEDRDEQPDDDDQLELRGVGQQRQPPARGLEQHALVDHRQLEVRVRVVDRLVAGLGDGDDRERGGGEQERRGEAAPARGGAVGRDRAQVGRSRGRDARRRARAASARLDERRDGDLAAGAHAPERAAGVERGERQHEPREREQAEDDEQVAQSGERRPCGDDRDQQHGDDHGREHDHRGVPR